MEQLLPIVVGNTVVALAIATAALLALLLRRPALSHVLWLLVVVKLLTPPVMRVPVSLPAWDTGAVATVPPVEFQQSPEPQEPVAVAEAAAEADAVAQRVDGLTEVADAPAAAAPVPARPSARVPAGQGFDGARMGVVLLIAAWAAGTAFYVGRVVRGARLLAALVRAAAPATPAVVARVRDVASRIGLPTTPDVRVVGQAASPMVVGMGGRPLLLLPAALVERLGDEALRAVIAHELAHLRRRDHWVRWLEAAATALLWWHPLLWLARRGLHEAEEQCCDAWVVWALPDARRAYADALVTTAGLLAETPTAAAVPPGASGLGQFQQLRRRLVMIMQRTTTRRGMSAAGKVVAAATLLTLAVLPEVAREQAGPAVALAAAQAAPATAAPAAGSVKSLQELIDKAKPGSEVTIPKGEWKEPVTVNKPIKLRGEDRDGCVIDVTSDQPAVRFAHKGEALLENVTIRWQLETSNRSPEPQAAVVTQDGNVRLRNVRVVASDNGARCPSGFTAVGFGTAKIDGCEFEGFEFTLQFANGAKADITESVVRKPGHCGITAGTQSTVNVTRTIVTGSGYHGLRCTGGTLNAEGNLVVANKNRGFYLGNKTARGTIRHNVIHGNGTGVSAFADSEVRVVNNVIAKSEFAAVDMRDTCRLKVENNLLANNARGLVLFKESGKNRNTIGRNASVGNQTESENFDPAPKFEKVEGEIAEGEFAPAKPVTGIGLKDPAAMKALWERYTQLKNPADAE